MNTQDSQSLNKSSFGNGLDKYTEKVNRLKTYVKKSKYIDVLEQPKVCASFGLTYLKNIFREEYRQRFYNCLQEHTTTAATVSKATGIPHKYCCEIKFFYEKRELLKVVYIGRCPTTGSRNVQFLSTNPEEWDKSDPLPKSNQTKLF